MTTVLLFVTVLLSSTIGWLLVSLLLRAAENRPGLGWMKIALGVGTGFGVTSMLGFVWRSAGLGFGPPYVAVEVILAAVLFVFFWITRRKVDNVYVDRRNIRAVMWIFPGIVLFLGLSTFALATYIAPSGMWDAWMVQNRAARFFFLGGSEWTNAFSPLLVSADYPLLVGMSVARLWFYVGKETIFAPALFALTLTAALVVLLISSVAYFRGQMLAYGSGLVLLMSSSLLVFAPAQLADVPISLYFLATMVLLSMCTDNASGGRSTLYLAGLVCALSIWTKNEGWLFAILVLLVYFVIIPLGRERKLKPVFLLQFLLGALPALLVILFFKFAFAPAYDFFRNQPADSSVWDLLLNPARYGVVLRFYLIQLVDLTPDRSSPLAALFILTLLFGIDREALRSSRFLSAILTLSLMVAGEFGIYLLTPHELQWQVSSSVHRLFLQLWPMFVFETMMLIKVPGGGSET